MGNGCTRTVSADTVRPPTPLGPYPRGVARLSQWRPAIIHWPVRPPLTRSIEMHDETRALLESMADAVDLRDPYTGGHSRPVTAYTAAILRALDMNGPEVELITTAARVHDIG